MLPTKFHFIWLRGFQRRRLQCEKLTDDGWILVSDWLISKKSSPLKPLGQMNRNLVGSIAWPTQAILVSDWLISKKIFASETAGPNESPCYASYQVSVHLAKRFQRRWNFRNQPIRNKNCMWGPCLLMNWDEMSNLHRGPSKEAYRLAKWTETW
jgi:hypothetical protein